MIHYSSIWQLKGSVFPRAARTALPVALLTAALSFLSQKEVIPNLKWLGEDGKVIDDSAAWTAVSSLIGFLIVFRTSQAYSRFWDGCTAAYQMRAEWLDACSSLLAFSSNSQATEEQTHEFRCLLIRLFSMIHALAFAEIEDSDSPEDSFAGNFELIDIHTIDAESLVALKESHHKVELVFQWTQNLIVQYMEMGVLNVPAPILSRAFQEFASGMVHFHDVMKISSTPFPFPYAQTCDVLLYVHSIITPFVMASWISRPWWAFVLSFTQVFIFWCLNHTAVELQNPFGTDANDIDAAVLQQDMNAQLLMLASPAAQRTPKLEVRAFAHGLVSRDSRRSSLSEPRASVHSNYNVGNVDSERRSSLHSNYTFNAGGEPRLDQDATKIGDVDLDGADEIETTEDADVAMARASQNVWQEICSTRRSPRHSWLSSSSDGTGTTATFSRSTSNLSRSFLYRMAGSRTSQRDASPRSSFRTSLRVDDRGIQRNRASSMADISAPSMAFSPPRSPRASDHEDTPQSLVLGSQGAEREETLPPALGEAVGATFEPALQLDPSLSCGRAVGTSESAVHVATC